MQADIFDDLYQDVRTMVASVSPTHEAKNAAIAQTLLSTQSFKAVLLIDGGIAWPKNKPLQKQLASYAKGGGTVIFSCLFSSFIRRRDMGKLWENFEQPWKSGDYHRTTFYVSQRIKTVLGPQRTAGLEREYSAKALHLKDVPDNSRVYVPLEQSRIESRVFAPDTVDNSQTPAAFHKYGEGWLAYIGDVNNEQGSQALLMAMLGESFSWLVVVPLQDYQNCEIRFCTQLANHCPHSRSDSVVVHRE